MGKEALSAKGPQATGSSGSPGWAGKIMRVGKLEEEVGWGSSARARRKQLFFASRSCSRPLTSNQAKKNLKNTLSGATMWDKGVKLVFMRPHPAARHKPAREEHTGREEKGLSMKPDDIRSNGAVGRLAGKQAGTTQ